MFNLQKPQHLATRVIIKEKSIADTREKANLRTSMGEVQSEALQLQLSRGENTELQEQDGQGGATTQRQRYCERR